MNQALGKLEVCCKGPPAAAQVATTPRATPPPPPPPPVTTPTPPPASCPPVTSLPPLASCAGRQSNCWSVGTADLDCLDDAFCCFDGCANVCMGRGGCKVQNRQEIKINNVIIVSCLDPATFLCFPSHNVECLQAPSRATLDHRIIPDQPQHWARLLLLHHNPCSNCSSCSLQTARPVLRGTSCSLTRWRQAMERARRWAATQQPVFQWGQLKTLEVLVHHLPQQPLNCSSSNHNNNNSQHRWLSPAPVVPSEPAHPPPTPSVPVP